MISGVPVRCGPPETWVAAIDETAERQCVRLAFVNTFTAYLIGKNPAFKTALSNFLLLNDGVGLDIVSRIAHGTRFEFNHNGTDFIPFFLKATPHAYRIYLFGGQPGIAERAATALKTIAPQHTYVGTHHGYCSHEQNAQVIAEIREKQTDILIVALGNPGQEMWIADHVERTGARLAIGAGALFDFLAGAVPRAPPWMRRAKLEWLYRMSLEPKRLWKRYVVFTPFLIGQAVADKLRFS